ncbi:hypothetical protein NDU88_010296 [Pleurodeles waltl]|uniref:Uncharacterized protein n=1 Tax=Pleurodeles waltl TaxID=8319 RepID=A0AAV7QVZ3_PLEWA|nr:hypothetical protein NDU88_010296 [Pleurodeles waltl]
MGPSRSGQTGMGPASFQGPSPCALLKIIVKVTPLHLKNLSPLVSDHTKADYKADGKPPLCRVTVQMEEEEEEEDLVFATDAAEYDLQDPQVYLMEKMKVDEKEKLTEYCLELQRPCCQKA